MISSKRENYFDRWQTATSTGMFRSGLALALAGLFLMGAIFSGCVVATRQYPQGQAEVGLYPEHSHEHERYPTHRHDYAESRRHSHQYDPPPENRDHDYGPYPRHSHAHERYPRHSHDYAESTRHEHIAATVPGDMSQYGQYPQHSHERERFPRHYHDLEASTRHTHDHNAPSSHEHDYGRYPRHSHAHERFPRHSHDYAESTRHEHKAATVPGDRPRYGQYPQHSHERERFPRHYHDLEASTRHTHQQMPSASPPPRDHHEQVVMLDYKKLQFDKESKRIIKSYYFALAHPGYNGSDKKIKKEIKKWLKKRKSPLPSGLERKEVLSPKLDRHSLPPTLIDRLPPPPPETKRIIVDGNVVLLHRPTQVVVDIIKYAAPRRDGHQGNMTIKAMPTMMVKLFPPGNGWRSVKAR